MIPTYNISDVEKELYPQYKIEDVELEISERNKAKLTYTTPTQQTKIFNQKCAKCFEVKQSTEFYKSLQNTTGLQSYCKECNKVLNLDRYYRNK